MAKFCLMAINLFHMKNAMTSSGVTVKIMKLSKFPHQAFFSYEI